MKTEVRVTLRLPVEASEFLSQMAKELFTSKNAEIVRSIKERMDREVAKAATKEKSGNPA
ncbi:Arc family DNA-binding protein [Labrys neptuniae]